MYITEERKAEIFGKEYITTQELQEVFNLRTRQWANQLMKKIKRVIGSDCKLRGKMWVQDFFDYYNIRIYADGSWFIPRNHNEPRKWLIDGRKLKIVRKKQGLTQAEAAAKSGIPTQIFRHIELEKNNPTLTTFEKIAKGLGVSIDDLTKDEYLKEKQNREKKRESRKDTRTAIIEQIATKTDREKMEAEKKNV